MKTIEKQLKILKEGGDLVAIQDTDKGSFLIIGDSLTYQCWAVTEQELGELYEILKKRYEK